MIAFNGVCPNNKAGWQSELLEMLPEIRRWLHLAFRHLDPDAREEAIEEGIVHSVLSYARLYDDGRGGVANASSLAWHATLAVKHGRTAGSRLNSKEPLSRYAQLGRGIRFERQNGEWIDKLVEDRRASVPDQVAAKLDVHAWFASLTQRMKTIARDLAIGCTTSEVAEKHGVTPGRISQLRRTLEQSWSAFQQESIPATA